MAAPTPTNIVAEEVHDDLLLSILDRVPCEVDRVKTSLVSKAWRDTIARLRDQGLAAPPPPLPWLLLPSREPDGPSRIVCVLSNCRGHEYLTINPPGERFVGSYDGAWIFLYSDKTREHRLFNARTRQVLKLPETLIRDREGHYGDDDVDPNFCSMVMLAATLSSSPVKSKCMGAAIVALDQAPDEVLQLQAFNRWIVFWRMGFDDLTSIMVPGVDVAADLAMYLTEDVVFHKRAFKILLTHGGDYQILMCMPKPIPEDPMALHIKWAIRRFVPPRELISHQNATVRARYLVVSRGELLMVVRFATGANQQTSEFKVFRATKRPKMPDAADFLFPVADYPWAWSDLEEEDTLGGRILFVGYGCSRSYEANQYPGFRPGIYFLDDGMFYEALIHGFANTRPYLCRDNGMWSEGCIRNCFPRPNSSEHSPPVWLLP